MSEDSPAWGYLTEEELRTELAAVWPDALPRPKRAKISADGLTAVYRMDEAKGASDAT